MPNNHIYGPKFTKINCTRHKLDEGSKLQLSPEMAAALIGSIVFGYNISCLDSCIGDIGRVFAWCGEGVIREDCAASQVQEGLVTASIYIGAAGGSVLIGVQRLARYGSRGFLCISSFFFLLGSLICGLAQGVSMLVVGRGLSGIGLGICGVMTPLYIGEMSPTKRRGACCALHPIFISVGILASIVIGLPQKPKNIASLGLNAWYWRVILIAPAPVALLQLVLHSFLFPSDSPRVLVERGCFHEAFESLACIHRLPVESSMTTTSDTILFEIQADLTAVVNNELQELVDAVEDAKVVSDISLFAAFMDGAYLRFPLVLGLFVACFQQLCGITFVYSYSNDLFDQAGIPPADLTLTSTAMGVVNVGANILSLRLVDSWGRRNLLLLGSAMQALSMGGLFFATAKENLTEMESLAVICLIVVFVVAFSLGLGSVTWLYLAEIYPMEIKSRALALCSGCNWLCSFAVCFGGRFLTVFEAGRLFGILCSVGCVLIYLFVLETKGCSLDDNPVSPRSFRSNSIVNSASSELRSGSTPPLFSPRSPLLTASKDPSSWSPRTPLLKEDIIAEREFSLEKIKSELSFEKIESETLRLHLVAKAAP